jgi:pseudaminic acid synthase
MEGDPVGLRNVLITSLSRKVPLVRCVRDALDRLNPSARIFGGDADPQCIGRHFVDEFWQMPRMDSLSDDTLFGFLKSNEVGFIIPTRDGELPFFAEREGMLSAKGIHVMVAPIDVVNRCLDKLAFYQNLQGARGFTPIPTHTELVPGMADRWVVKERFGSGSRNIGLNLTASEGLSHAATLDEPVFQPYIQGREYSVDLYSDVRGQVHGSVVRTRDVVVNGESQITTSLSHPLLERASLEAAKTLGLRNGHSILQFIVDESDSAHLVECNCRFGGASTAAVAVGLDIFYWFLLERQGISLERHPFRPLSGPIRMIRYPKDVFFLINSPSGNTEKSDGSGSKPEFGPAAVTREIPATREPMEFQSHFTIEGKKIGPGCPVYVIAEISANHGQSYEDAVHLVQTAAEIGADAVKLQTYTPDTLTIDCEGPSFSHTQGSLWESKTLYEIYKQGMMPWEWQPKLKKIATGLGLTLFSTPYDASAVQFLEEMNVPAYKISSFELVDLPLIRRVARTGKPILLSTGMATFEEIFEALEAIWQAEGQKVALLKCTSGYPTPASAMNLRTIGKMIEEFEVPCGLSDHCLEFSPSLMAVGLGACIIEKHLTLSLTRSTLDKGFSLEPQEFKVLIEQIRIGEQALGSEHFGPTFAESESLGFRRSLYVIRDVRTGERLTHETVRSIRPAGGLPPKHWPGIEGKRAARDLKKGTPLSWEDIA